MKGRGRALLWSIGLLLAMPLWAGDPGLARIDAQLVRAPVLRGEFSQSKRIEGFSHPLRSSGRFVVALDKGVLWETLAPFPSSVVLTREQLISRQPDGGSKVLVGAENPALEVVQALLMALIVGDLGRLQTQFEIRSEDVARGWAVRLIPTDPMLQQVFSEVELGGGAFVERVTLSEPGGDRSEIEFAQMSTAAPELSDAEAALFE
ncbi:MAG: outer membrane lipoprotein carrier protein LolA [Xanthomonadales bacterium]|nr:outer membrane lipoprotein carrier protein LolA [Xanthomonadales bacterium]